MYSRRSGALHLEDVRLADLLRLETPFYVYSLGRMRRNWQEWADALQAHPRLSCTVAFAVKANNNQALLSCLSALGAGAVVVSECELRHALRCGFPPDRMLFHGNGKRPQDIAAALSADVLLSADSLFDLRHIDAAARQRGRAARVLLRINPDIDAHVHPYISTGLLDSKFGIAAGDVAALREALSQATHLQVHGLHCHLGSTLRTVQPVVDATHLLLALAQGLRADGHPLQILDLGGGLDIDYTHNDPSPLTPGVLLSAVAGPVAAAGLRLLLEPGRRLVGDIGALIGRVVGVKGTTASGDPTPEAGDRARFSGEQTPAAGDRSPVSNDQTPVSTDQTPVFAGPPTGRRFLVTDASMAQLIRPSLYDAYHRIELLEDRPGPLERFDVVGPICESADFLGKDRWLAPPQEGDGVLIHDAGAYGFVMASRYNMHLLCAEYTIDGSHVRRTRRAETYDDFASTFVDEEVST